ncbi:bifunctional diguanylate cyclase/phosphodiesterase [Sphingomonas rhizophila]|uniref:Bifunctional diguanylate cyclase/phosphodiesterase n=1 Tax=Sphingomonas rhizophila TaxID=2071607 RepID=A0A7G9S8Q6_9SPHN|nr:bifunctional diguanylate cyclase/phosphodiesterase [Sphingomonas rhizophila]QNN64231.1 bifunctional diguanylate cyclase/phosphodiesterase [Sphingomonas rhizophila]
MLLIWNGSEFFQRLSLAQGEIGPSLKLASAALILNVALILFGWRRYIDLQHEAERRAEGERRARTIASTDGMTGLLNRKGFGDQSLLLREQAAQAGEQFVILSLRLHRFKSVNDRHGFDVGDAVIRKIADAISDSVPDTALVARLSGDEFAVALSLAPEDLDRASEIGMILLQSTTRPFEEQTKFIQVGAFIGIANANPDSCSVPDLLRRADIALDHARSARSVRPSWFDAGMERALLASSEIEQGIRFGLEHDQFVPYFEPQVDLATGEIGGFEVLARWRHPLTGIVTPDSFIGIAEENGLLDRLSDQVVRKAFLAAAKWDNDLTLSINISPTQLADSWLAQKIVRMLHETQFPAERLIVEITESSLFADLELARAIVTSLKAQGIRLALDDFGSGFSSLSHLRALPFDLIKIDRSFVSSLHEDRQSFAIVNAVTTLAKALDVPVVAEGIEDAETHQALISIDCAKGQGWYFGKAMSAEDAAQLLRIRAAERSVQHGRVAAAR